jgi:hypothetical protein
VLIENLKSEIETSGLFDFILKPTFMKKLPLFLLLIVLTASCSFSKKTNDDKSAPKQVTLNVKNASNKEVILKLKNKTTDDLSIVLPKDSVYELIGLEDSCSLFHETLNKKYDFMSYQKGDSIPIILIDKSNNKQLAISDIYPVNGLVSINLNSKTSTVEKFTGVFSIN